MSTGTLLIIFGISFSGLLVLGSDLYRIHRMGPRVWKELRHPDLSNDDFYLAFGIHWILVVVCAVTSAVAAAIYITRFLFL